MPIASNAKPRNRTPEKAGRSSSADKAAVEGPKQVTTEEIVKSTTTGDGDAPANRIVAASKLPSGDILLHTNTPQEIKGVSSIKLNGSKGSTPQRKSKEEPIESSSTV
jgi:hypothetical protein